MGMLVGGLALFFAAHLIPTLPKLRVRLVGMMREAEVHRQTVAQGAGVGR